MLKLTPRFNLTGHSISARGERLLRTPGTRAYVTNAPRQGRGEILQPLPGRVSLFLFYPGVRFAHPRLSSFRPAGAQFGTTEAMPSRSEAMNTKFDRIVNFVRTKKT